MSEIITLLTQAMPKQGSFVAKQSLSSEVLIISLRASDKTLFPLKWPISKTAAKSMIKLARPAKYGLKEKTLLDPSVRDVWEIPKSRVKIDNRQWQQALQPCLEKMKAQLGLPENSQLKAHLHNMLIYESGQFFKRHQDSEKLDDMVASLVVVLPSEHTGGTLVIEHQEECKRITSGKTTKDKLSLIAFFADCHHAITPVKTGYRVTLTYNIELISDSHFSESHQTTDHEHYQHLLSYFKQFFYPTPAQIKRQEALTDYRSVPKPKQWVYFLDHQYTQKSLRWQRLKNTDQFRVDSLLAVAKALKLKAFLTLVEQREVWECDEGEDDSDYFYDNEYWDDDDEDETQEDNKLNNEESYQMGDMILDESTFTYWVDEQQNVVNEFKGMYISNEMIYASKGSDQFTPFNSEYEGYTGNAGNTMDRWYHRTALVLWREQDHDAILYDRKPQTVFKDLLQQAKSPTQRHLAQARVQHLLPFWSEDYKQKRYDSNMLTLLYHLAVVLQSETLAQALLQPLGLHSLRPSTAKHFATLLLLYDDKSSWGQTLLTHWSSLQHHSGQRLDKLSSIIKTLMQSNQHKASLPVLKTLLAYNLKQQIQDDTDLLKHATRSSLHDTEKERIAAVSDLITAYFYLNEKKQHQTLIQHMLQHESIYYPDIWLNIIQYSYKLMPTAIFRAWQYPKLIIKVRKQLQSELKEADRPAGNWSIDVALACSCQDCKTLQDFLLDPSETSLVWPMSKDRRRHMHHQIDEAKLPLTHKTQRLGSPHKLVLTKTPALFKQSKQRVQVLNKALKKLTQLT